MLQYLIQPKVSIISCPSEKCIYPFNLSMTEIQQENLLITDVETSDIMTGMQHKMVNEALVNEKIAQFISKEDGDLE